MLQTEAKKLSPERLEAIWTTLKQVGQAEAAAALKEHVAALEEQNMLIEQYYEEHLIPAIEGRPIGKVGKTWLERTGGRVR